MDIVGQSQRRRGWGDGSRRESAYFQDVSSNTSPCWLTSEAGARNLFVGNPTTRFMPIV